MKKRSIENAILKAAKSVPVITITGPRQSGKTTLVKMIFPDYSYINFEDIEIREFAIDDPKGFLKTAGTKVIFDEIQNVPELFSYIQIQVDIENNPGMYVLTGSQNFLLMEKVTQTLAGRTSIFHLLPFSVKELGLQKSSLADIIHKGFYPRIHVENIDYNWWYEDYIQTYVERDVRKLINITDLGAFRNFLKICAGRTGQLINLSELGNEISVSYQTIRRWISMLETSYIIFTVNPYYKNFNKRIIKSSKIYFYDTGLLCNLLGLRNPSDYHLHFLKGGIFESFVISEIKKMMYNKRIQGEIYFFRDSRGNEVDCIIETGGDLMAIEIKAGATVKNDFFKGLTYWRKLTGNSTKNFIIYGGDSIQERSDVTVLSWNSIEKIFS